MGHVCHGGMLATFAGMFLPIAARFQAKTDIGFLPTVNLSCDYLAPAPLGAWVRSRADLVTATRNLLCAQGMASADGVPVLPANGIFKVTSTNSVRSRDFSLQICSISRIGVPPANRIRHAATAFGPQLSIMGALRHRG